MRIKQCVNIVAIAVISISFIYGCGKNDKAPGTHGKLVARIDSYELTKDDFNDAMRSRATSIRSAKDIGKAKEELLESLITKQVLLLEAQKQNFDKDKAFMKEIEKYWEQALLKLLIKKKMSEFSGTLKDDTLVDEAMEKWIEGLKMRTDIKRYKENL